MSDRVLIGDAAVGADVPLHKFISWLHRSGALLVVPGTEDARCWLPSGLEQHAEGCGCGFTVAHPCVQPV